MKRLPFLSSNKPQVLAAPALFLLFCCTCTHHFFTLTHAQTQTTTRRHHKNQRALNLFKSTKIINGKEATPSRYPYIASLQKITGYHFCGGSIIAPDIVLTAAHCMEGKQDSLDIYHVVVGRHDLKEDSKEKPIKMKRMVLHPLYNFTSADNDFSVVQLAKPIREEEGIGMIKLNSDSAVPEAGAATTVMGWGDTNPAESESVFSDVLMETEVFVMSNERCWDVTENMLCVWARETSSCTGDSGGPLVIKGNTPDQDLLVGVVSWGFSCANEWPSTYYARISAQYEWIREQVCGLSLSPPAYFQCTAEMMFIATPSSQPSTSMSPSSSHSVTPSSQPTTTNVPTVTHHPTPAEVIAQLNETNDNESNSNQTPSSDDIPNWQGRVLLVYFLGSAATLLLLLA